MADKQPKWAKAFITALTIHGGVTRAAKEAKIGRARAYEYRDQNQDFATAWKEAIDLYADDLEVEARKRAVEGIVVEETIKDGKVIGKKLKYSDTLLIFLLKGARPEKFAERSKVEHEVTISSRLKRAKDRIADG